MPHQKKPISSLVSTYLQTSLLKKSESFPRKLKVRLNVSRNNSIFLAWIHHWSYGVRYFLQLYIKLLEVLWQFKSHYVVILLCKMLPSYCQLNLLQANTISEGYFQIKLSFYSFQYKLDNLETNAFLWAISSLPKLLVQFRAHYEIRLIFNQVLFRFTLHMAVNKCAYLFKNTQPGAELQRLKAKQLRRIAEIFLT